MDERELHLVNSVAGGNFMKMEPDEALRLFD
jgi:hypothetical protein